MQHEKTLAFFAKVIEKELGIIYADHNYYQLQNRLEDIANFLGVATLDDLWQKAQSGIQGHFKQLLLDVATNNETSFFRDAKIFTAIESSALKPLAASTTTPSLTIWSAASSSGQEALSLCMVILEWCQKNGKKIDFKIVATDISERILNKAKAAKYSQLEVQRGLPAALMIKYFQKDENDFWRAKEELTRHIEYRKLNLKDPFQFTGNFDLILCRNVLIYQNVEGKKEVLDKIYKVLSPSGFVVLGAGESLIGLTNDFQAVSSEGAILYSKRNERAAA